MKRTELLNALNMVKPALARNDLIPSLSMFWFREGRVLAYNEEMAIQVPIDIDFTGAVSGDTLVKFLNSSSVDEVVLSSSGDSATLKLGKTKGKLAFLPEDDLKYFDMPDIKKNHMLSVDTRQFLIGLESCLRSIGTDVAVPDQLGITIIRDGDKLDLYSTDRTTLSHAEVDIVGDCPLDDGERLILPAGFCRQLLKILQWKTTARFVEEDEDEAEVPEGEATDDKKAAKEKPKDFLIEVNEKYVLMKSGGVSLYGRIIHADVPLNFPSILKNFLPPKAVKHMVPIPAALAPAIERANIIVSSSVKPIATKIEVGEAKSGIVAHLHSKAESSEVTDNVVLGDEHPDVEMQFTPKHVRKGIESFDKILFDKKAVIFKKGKLTYMVSAYSGS